MRGFGCLKAGNAARHAPGAAALVVEEDDGKPERDGDVAEPGAVV